MAVFAGAGTASAQTGVLVYAPNSATNTVSTYSANADGTLTSTGTVTVGGQPLMAAVRGDQAFAYVTNANDNTVSVIDTGTRTVVQTVTGVLGLPQRVVVSPDSTKLYVVSNGGQLYTFSINASTGQLTQTAFLATGLNQPRGMAIAPNGSTLYVPAASGLNVGVVDTATNTVTTTISVGNIPVGVSVHPDGSRVYVGNVSSNTVSVIDTATNTVTATVTPNNSPTGTIVAPDGVHWYVTNQNAGTVSQFNTSDNSAVAAPVATGSTPLGLTVSPDGNTLYVTNRGASDRVQAFSIAPGTGALASIGTTAAGDDPAIPGICSNGNAFLTSGRTLVASTVGTIGCTGSAATFTGGTLQVNAASISTPQPVVLGSGGGTIDTNGNNATLSGAMTGTGALTKIGAGTLTFTGTNTYSGPTAVNNGTLIVSGSLAAGSTVSVASGARLGGIGTAAGNVTVTGELAPGAGGPGQFGTGNLTLNAGSVLAIELNGPTAGTGYDRVNVSGTVTLGGATLSLGAGYVPAFGQVFTIIDNDGGDAIVGTFAGLAEGAPVTLSGILHHISYVGGTGNDVTLTAINVPGAPTLTGAVAGNAQITVSFSAPASNGGSPITGYTANCGGVTATGTVPSIVVGGLVNGTPYTCTVLATNAVGNGPPSAPSASVTPFTIAGAPSITTVTPGNSQIVVAFTPPASGGSPITSYTANCGGVTATGVASPVTVAGLVNGTPYTCTVLATNAGGPGPSSAPSASVTPFTIPAAPAITSVGSGNAQLVVAFTAPANNGSAITGYTASCGGITATGTASPVTVTGLTNGTPYTCTVLATNAAGNGPPSAPSASVIPVANSFTGPSATGSGTITASFTGGGLGCTFTTPQFIPLTGHPASPPGATPNGVTFPHGLFDFRTTGCTPASAITMTITYPAALPAGTQYWKYGPTPGNATPHWYTLPATIAGTTATFTITDGGLGDDDLAANGTIVDQGGPGVPGAPGTAAAVPTLSEWMLILLATLMLAFGLRRTRG